MSCTASSLVASAYANGYAKLSHRGLLEALVASACAGGAVGGGGQIVAYTGADPNSDGVTPSNVNAAAVAVKPNNPIYTWSVAGQNWQ